MKNFHIEIDIDKDGDMLICEDGCTGEHYHIEEKSGLDDMIDQIVTCLGDYLRAEYDDHYLVSVDLLHTDSEKLKQLRKDIEERGCIMPKAEPVDHDMIALAMDLTEKQLKNGDRSKAEVKRFHVPNDLTNKAKLQKNSLYGKTVCENDPVNHPSHYTDGKIEVIDFIEDKKLNFHLANAVKYISRAGKKDPNKEIEDLKKARWYLDRYIQKLEAEKTEKKEE